MFQIKAIYGNVTEKNIVDYFFKKELLQFF